METESTQNTPADLNLDGEEAREGIDEYGQRVRIITKARLLSVSIDPRRQQQDDPRHQAPQ